MYYDLLYATKLTDWRYYDLSYAMNMFTHTNYDLCFATNTKIVFHSAW